MSKRAVASRDTNGIPPRHLPLNTHGLTFQAGTRQREEAIQAHQEWGWLNAEEAPPIEQGNRAINPGRQLQFATAFHVFANLGCNVGR